MFNLFNKSKVKAGKQNNAEQKPAGAPAAASKPADNKKAAPFAALGKTWAKLNQMDKKQAYTYGAIAVVVLVALLTLGSAMGAGDEDNFYDLQTRGYDLANMPFSSDEAEQYLLASKYPDMKDNKPAGLYSQEEKEARQEEEAADVELDTSVTSSDSEYVPGRYYNGGALGPVSTTQVGTLNSASLKGASGSGVSGTFGPTGDFSNFKSQEKGKDTFTKQGPGTGDARKALFQSAVGSRAAAGQKDAKLLNAKKAMMGGNVKGSDAFLSDSGAVNLGDAKGLNLDSNAPVSSADLSGLDQGIQDAKDAAEDEAQETDEKEMWEVILEEFAKKAIDVGMNMFQTWAGNFINQQMEIGANANAEWTAMQMDNYNNRTIPVTSNGDISMDSLNNMADYQLKELGITKTGLEGGGYSYTYGNTTLNSTDAGGTLTLGQEDIAKANAFNAKYQDMKPRQFANAMKDVQGMQWQNVRAQAKQNYFNPQYRQSPVGYQPGYQSSGSRIYTDSNTGESFVIDMETGERRYLKDQTTKTTAQ